MADPSRDLKVAVLSDADRFDLAKPADQLEELADQAGDAGRDLEDAGRSLDRLGEDATDAGRDLERAGDAVRDLGEDAGRRLRADLERAGDAVDDLGEDATGAARKIDGAMDKIAAASTRAGRDVDAGMDRAEKGLDEFKDEAGSSGREAAASFSGEFDDIGDLIQETAANAFAGFGPLGAAAGIAAAAGIGLLTKTITEAREKFDELRKSLTAGLIDGAGRLAGEQVLEKVREFAEDGSITDLADQARAAKVPVSDYLLALAGDPAAIDRTRAALEKYRGEHHILTGQTSQGAKVAAEMRGELDRAAAASGLAADAANTYAIAAAAAGAADEQAQARNEEYAASLLDTAGAGEVMAGAIEAAATRQAAATKSTEDSWQDYADTATASIDDVIAAQEEQLAAAADYEANTTKVLDRLGQEAVDWALAQGENADKAMKLLADAPVEKGRRVVDNWTRLGGKSTAGYADGIVGNQRETNQAMAIMSSWPG